MAYIKAKQPAFLFVHLDHVDGAGHAYGHGTPQYYQAVAKADTLIDNIGRPPRMPGSRTRR